MFKIIIFIFIITSSICSFANLELAPPSFEKMGRVFIFTDFLKADYKILFDINKRKAELESTIIFNINKSGYPIFDLVTEPEQIWINNIPIEQEIISSPDSVTKFRFIKMFLSPGTYILKIKSKIKNNIKFTDNTVDFRFDMKDMSDRGLLEKYFPTNLEYDQYKMNIQVSLKGSETTHRLQTNGKVSDFDKGNYKIVYPKYFNSSAIYFHYYPANKYYKVQKIYKSRLPITVYSKSEKLSRKYLNKTISKLEKIESFLGKFPHPRLIVFTLGQNTSGMEYAGAIYANKFSLYHEILHCYFARGVMPANGNSGWIDEGIATWDDWNSWNDWPVRNSSDLSYESYNIANRSPYQRKTHKSSKSYGKEFMSYINFLIKDSNNGNLRDFLRFFFNKRKFQVINTEIFRNDLEEYLGFSLEDEFNRYIYGIKN